MQVQDLFNGFIQDCKCRELAVSTITGHTDLFSRIIIPSIGTKEVASLLPIHANEIIERAQQFGRSTARHSILTFRRFLHYLKKCRIPCAVTAEEVEIPVYRRCSDVKAWSRGEIKELRALLSTDHSEQFSKHCSKRIMKGHQLSVKRTRALFELMLHSGLRLSEALSVNRDNIDWETNELRVEDAKEAGVWKTVFLHGAAHAIDEYLAMRTDTDRALFVSMDGKRLCRNSAGTALKRLKKRGQLSEEQKRVLTHKTCRSSFITLLLKDGVDPKLVQNLAHHRSLHTTLNYYRKVTTPEMKNAHVATFATL